MNSTTKSCGENAFLTSIIPIDVILKGIGGELIPKVD